MYRRVFVVIAMVALAFTIPAAASADVTLGTTLQPSGSLANGCPSSPPNQLLLATSGPFSGPYTVPSLPTAMALTRWQVNTALASSGTQLTVVLFTIDVQTESITVVGTDTETVNTVGLPADKVETFTLPTAIPVQAGEFVGLYKPGSSAGFECYWSGGSISGTTLGGLPLSGPPVAGGTYMALGGGGVNVSDGLVNLGATLSPLTYDAGVSLSAGPSDAIVGQPAVLTATLTNHGPMYGPITFTDPVPNGLTIEAASVASGTCTTNAGLEIVTCTTDAVAVGQSTQVVIVVKPTAAQSYTDRGAVSLPDGAIDPNAANDNATATLKVIESGASAKCVVPKLGGASVAIAKRVLPLLGCKVGKTRRSHSKSVAKGLLIGTSPGAGSYPLGKKITLKVSSGR